MSGRHRLLERQIRRHFGEAEVVPPHVDAFLEDVHSAYVESDVDRGMLERALDLSSEELFEANSELRALLAALPDLVMKLDADGRVQDVKSRPQDLAMEPRQLLGRRIQDAPFLSSSAEIGNVVRTVSRERESRSAEYSLRIGGRTKHYEIRLLPFLTDQILAVVRDVTELRESEHHLTQTNELLRAEMKERQSAEERQREAERQLFHAQKMESLGVLAGGIAHDFNNILVGILGNASLARLDVDDGSLLGDVLQEIEQAAKRASELTGQMLAYTGKGQVVTETVDLEGLVDEMLHLLRATISKKARLERDFATDLPAVTGDPTQIRQVFMNLVTNASEALEDGVGTIRVRAHAKDFTEDSLGSAGAAPGPHVVLDVVDNGCGMDSDTLQRMFEPFYTTKFTGRGLGLSAVDGIVRAHGGWIEVDTVLGEGTRCTVVLPAAEAPAPSVAVADASPKALGQPGNGQVLVVDDDPNVRKLFDRVLRRSGLEPLLAADGAQGLTELRTRADSLLCVFLDVTMPVVDGTEVLDRARALAPDLPIFLMSGYTEDLLDAGHADAMAGFLHKPFTVADVHTALAMVLGARV